MYNTDIFEAVLLFLLTLGLASHPTIQHILTEYNSNATYKCNIYQRHEIYFGDGRVEL